MGRKKVMFSTALPQETIDLLHKEAAKRNKTLTTVLNNLIVNALSKKRSK